MNEILKYDMSQTDNKLNDKKTFLNKCFFKPEPKPYIPDPNKPHIIIHKGIEGFADRLQVLSNSMEYAKLNSAYLSVDWSDYWFNDDFYYYFEVLGIKTIKPDEITWDNKTYFPDIPIEEAKDPITKDNYNKGDPKRLYLSGCLLKRDYDILINHGATVRQQNNENLIRGLRFTPAVKDVISAVIKKLNILGPNSFPLIHLRGTDRRYGKKIDDILFPIRKQIKKHNYKKCYCVYDDVALYNRLKDFIEILPIEHEYTKKIDSTDGSHAQVLKNKRGFNIDMLLDFCLIASASKFHSCSAKSYFNNVARSIHANHPLAIFSWFAP
jgi:hypothetical protein